DVRSLDQALDVVCATIDWYYYSYHNDPVYLGVWMGTETDQDLFQLNIEHSGRVAAVFEIIRFSDGAGADHFCAPKPKK
ncbi:hypothetical protein ACC699_40165, partial [Rhizobium ruizarguesonis]